MHYKNILTNARLLNSKYSAMYRTIVFFTGAGFFSAVFSNSVRYYPLFRSSCDVKLFLFISVFLFLEPMLHVVLTSIGFAIGYPLHLVEEKFHREQIKRFEEQAALYAGQEDQ